MATAEGLPSPAPDPQDSEHESKPAYDAAGDKCTADLEVAAAAESSIDPENEISNTRLQLVHMSICLCTFLVGLDFNVVATAIPVITSNFGTTKDVGWYGASFMVALCASQPLAGKTYVLFPKKLTYMSYLAVLEIGSLICALAPSSPVLIVGRAIAGLGASGIFAGGFAILTTVVSIHKRAIYTGTMSSAFSVASIVGPVLGGGLTQRISWRWCFYINLPIGGLAAALFIPFCSIRQPSETEKLPLNDKIKCLDPLGFLLFAGSVAMLLFALQWGGLPEYPWKSATIICLLFGSIVTMALFVGWQLRRGRRWNGGGDSLDSALIPPRLFTVHRNVSLLCAGSFFVNGPFQLIIYWLPLWLQAVLGVNPTQSAIYYFPTVISDVLAGILGSAIVMKLGWWNPFLIFGNSMVCLGAGLLSTITPGISHGHWIGYQIFGGIGYSLVTNMAHIGMQASLPKELVPLGASTLLMVISTSCAIFLAVGQAVFQKRLSVNLSSILRPETVNKIFYGTGATEIGLVVPSGGDVAAVVQQYGKSITQVLYIPASAPVLSVALVSACAWISVKKPDGQQQKKAVNLE